MKGEGLAKEVGRQGREEERTSEADCLDGSMNFNSQVLGTVAAD